MTKRKPVAVKSRSPSPASAGQSAARPSEPSPTPAGVHHLLPSAAAIRETIESVAIAFVLAFLFRTFEAEAFVIPTGSMAPTLMGRHKDVVCPKCGCPYQVSASEEVTSDGSPKMASGPDGVLRKTVAFDVVSGTCPMCRYTDDSLEKKTSYNGDRILVNKFAYEVSDPKRWDVIVFKYPGDPPTDSPSADRTDSRTDSRTNFIKRLVGLPGDTIRIQDGDVWVQSGEEKKVDGAGFAIARKPGPKLLAMLQPVFDNDYMPKIAQYGWPARWYPPAGSAAGAWQTGDSGAFTIDGTAKDEQWLRYHHLVPLPQQWQQVGGQSAPPVKPQLVTDFTAYDTGKMRHANPYTDAHDPDGLGTHWVGDLALACTADVESDSGTLAFELRKGGRQFQCRVDLSTGRATLSISGPDMAAWHPTALTNVRGKGRHKILFSNCDDELRLWVDGDAASFDAPTTYPELNNSLATGTDLEPVGIASVAAQVRIGHLRVLRDIYYIADRWDTAGHDVWYQYGEALPNHERPRREPRYVEFDVGKDKFFVLGDNSSKSRDSRLWGPDFWVPRDLLIGKALFIYWPHSWHRLPYVDIPFPFFPNFSRMGLVR